jgi:plastocyanin
MRGLDLKEKFVRAAVVIGAVLAVFVLSGCGGPAGPTLVPGPTILLGSNDTIFCGVFDSGTAATIHDNTFDPPSITIAVGEQVDFVNEDDVTHVIKFDSGTTCGTVMAGTVKKVRFSAAGFFPYHCTIHDNMRGEVTVQ